MPSRLIKSTYATDIIDVIAISMHAWSSDICSITHRWGVNVFTWFIQRENF